MSRRTEQIHIAASPSEKSALKEAARRKGISLSEMLREAGLREAGRELRRDYQRREVKNG